MTSFWNFSNVTWLRNTWWADSPPGADTHRSPLSMTPYFMQNSVVKWVDFQNFPKFEPIARKLEKQFFMTLSALSLNNPKNRCPQLCIGLPLASVSSWTSPSRHPARGPFTNICKGRLMQKFFYCKNFFGPLQTSKDFRDQLFSKFQPHRKACRLKF